MHNVETDRVITPTTHSWRAPHSVVRKVLTEERCEFRDHVLRLSMDDRCRRFCGAVNDAFITRYCLEGRGYPRVVIGFWVDRVMRGAGEIIFPLPDGDPGLPEIALSVEAPFQNQGIGTTLVRRLLTIARNRGADLVRIVSQHDNRRVRALALKFGARISAGMDSELEMFIAPPPANYLMYLEELLDHGDVARATLSSGWWNTTAQLAGMMMAGVPGQRSGFHHQFSTDEPPITESDCADSVVANERTSRESLDAGQDPRSVDTVAPANHQ
jgi:RimJ/RimL family protein N-acetyltransferase